MDRIGRITNETLSLILCILDVRECSSGHAAKARQGTKPLPLRWGQESFRMDRIDG
jgi:hypothetical protein